MNLREFLKKHRLTERERQLVIEAWIEASGVFDDGEYWLFKERGAPRSIITLFPSKELAEPETAPPQGAERP